MSYKPGDVVVHPQHGTAVVGAVEMRDIGTGPVEYVRLDIDAGGLTVLVPASGLSDSGVRDPAGEGDAEAILDVLSGQPEADAGHRLRRQRDAARIASGGLKDAAAVLRDLAALGQDRGELRHADRAHFDEARHALVSELALAWGVDPEEAGRRVDAALEGALATRRV